jgi:hypothetical protein
MKKVSLVLTVALVATLLNLVHPGNATARPQYFKQFQAHYKDSDVLAAAKKEKCLTCHFGKKKKDRNDYGKALSKHLTKKQFSVIKKNKNVLTEKITEALKLVEKEKSVSGTLFGKLIEAGKLPGTAPEEAPKEQ